MIHYAEKKIDSNIIMRLFYALHITEKAQDTYSKYSYISVDAFYRCGGNLLAGHGAQWQVFETGL